MNNKYADLPDIDTAPDIYETEDIFPTTQPVRGDTSDEESAAPRTSQHTRNSRHADGITREELDISSVMRADQASKHFRKAERRQQAQSRLFYTYSPWPSSRSPSPPGTTGHPNKKTPLSHRLRVLQAEISALENEMADPSNSALEENMDPGELIKGLVDVRGRIDKIRNDKVGRGRLLGAVMGDVVRQEMEIAEDNRPAREQGELNEKDPKSSIKTIVEMDRRISQLEGIVGSANTALDEMTPLPPPLLPLMTRLNNQLLLLTQPRHVDSISRRLKLLLSDLDRVSMAQHHRRHFSQHMSSPVQDQLLPVLSRLNPTLPQIPHILTRLRALSSLHSAAGDFKVTLDNLEKERGKIQDALRELQQALTTIETSLDDNQTVVRLNVAGLEKRINEVTERIDTLISRNDRRTVDVIQEEY
ncbi:hypothetical protein AMATHDRAFT_46595 [Amanita thiersii Skay4041]|uniref:Uncharacterized protein n=1 Tax=Amanita thiersii Skay4041 TaxID=703135 RepID=A0A2A9NW20_9AGAR|nr:hypothetical protein AMATHDRAFT_46595 [Amanita thiersii Skay4041]